MRFVGIILLWLACFIQCIVPVLALQTIDDQIESIMSSMSLHQKINQMAQIDFSLIFSGDGVDQGKLEYYFGEQGFGSLLVVGTYADASFYRDVMERVQNVAKAYNLPPVIAGIDSVHGANYVKGAIIFPQQINIASTFNPMHAKYAGKIAARDSLAGGINWVFSPILGLGIQPLWARMFETFGEDPPYSWTICDENG
jgi:beta-glucosidase